MYCRVPLCIRQIGIGTVINQVRPDFFVFSDARGGTYNFSVLSVQTNSLVNNPGVSTSGTLYVLGNLIDANLNFLTPTASSLSIQFNSTGGSAFSSALTLAVPPAVTAVPEPASWAMMIVGMGLVGGSLRRRSKVATRMTFG
ncbi:MAG: PEP-CTERM sorting domain-containing protein [Oxalobacteraceae bacterium]|nr:MAG: PEP-CTERM sorting domain-containing protein [Oxalobacteraceae bacterium]